jgi:hypothetical protein
MARWTDENTMEELRQAATDAELEGRSSMTKEQLIAELNKGETGTSGGEQVGNGERVVNANTNDDLQEIAETTYEQNRQERQDA